MTPSAWVQYLRITGLNQVGGKGDTGVGYAVSRPTGDRAYVAQVQQPPRCLHPDPTMGRSGAGWSPRDSASRAGHRWDRIRLVERRPPGNRPSARWASPGRDPVPSLSPSSWSATSSREHPGRRVPIRSREPLASRGGGPRPDRSARPKPTPLPNRAGTRDNELFVSWNFADARWLDLARAWELKRTVRTGWSSMPGRASCEPRTTPRTSNGPPVVAALTFDGRPRWG